MDRCIDQLFEAQVAKTPDDVALESNGAVVTYRELNRCANHIAAALRAAGVQRKAVVGVYAQRSPEAVAAILGILKTGGAYLPLEPDHPRERLKAIASTSGLSLILATGQAPGQDLGASCLHLRSLNDSWTSEDTQAATTMERSIHDLAVVLYTSGSTGRPKGVGISHKAIVARFRNGYPFRPHDIQKASLGVVGHFSDLLLPLTEGHTVSIATDLICRDPDLLARFVEARGATRLVFVPSHLRSVLERESAFIQRFRLVDTVVVGGEPLTPDLVELFFATMPWATLINGYGATETAGFVSLGEVTSSRSITVGMPVRGTDIYILNDNLAPVSPGTTGHIYVSGEQLASQYLNEPALTTSRFVRNPFRDDGSLMYLTGDVGRWTLDGRFEIVRREEGELKLRGHRVHAAEVEAALTAHPAVNVAFATVVDDDTEATLIAYLGLASGSSSVSRDALHAHLSARLPGYMIPQQYYALNGPIPQLPSGKVDRHTILSTLSADATPLPPFTDGVRASFSDTERILADIWGAALKVPAIARSDRFMDLGGDSLKAITVVLAIEEQCSVRLSMDAILGNATLEAVGRLIESDGAPAPSYDHQLAPGAEE